MTKDEALKHAPEGTLYCTPNSNMFVRVGKNGFVEVCRLGEVVWREIPMTLDECYLEEIK